MKRILVTTVLACWLVVGGSFCAVAQQNNPPSYAVMSLVGDNLTFSPYLKRSIKGGADVQVGTRSNLEYALQTPVDKPVFDDTVEAAIANALQKLVPNAAVDMLSTRNARLFALQGKLLDPNDAEAAAARESLKALLKERKDDYLILVTKRRSETGLLADPHLFDDAHLKLMKGSEFDDSGRLEGLGFYLDDTVRVENLDTLFFAHGVLVAYCNTGVTLIDARTLTVIRDLPKAKSSIVSESATFEPNSAWEDVSDSKKFKSLQDLMMASMTEAVPAILH